MSYKVLNARFFKNLGHCVAVTENIGNPTGFGSDTECFFGEANTVEKLTYKGFARNKVTVGLNPHCAYVFPSSLFDTLFNLLIEVGISVSHFNICRSGTLGEDEIVILFHKTKHCCVSSAQFTDILLVCPHKYNIKVGVTHKSKSTLRFIGGIVVNLVFKYFLSLAKPLFKRLALKVEVYESERFFKSCSDKFCKSRIVNGHKERIENRLEIPIDFFDFRVDNANKRTGKCFYR